MKILAVNRNFFLTGGPEKYLFSLQQEMGDSEFIPFSAKFEQNLPTKYSNFFVSPPHYQGLHRFNPDALSIIDRVRYAFNIIYSCEAKEKLAALIDHTRPDVAFFLNAVFFSQSIIDACRSRGVPIVWRLSDFNMICGNYLLFNNNKVCTKCVNGSLSNILINRCGGYQKSLLAAVVRFLGMQLAMARGVYRHVSCFVCPSAFTRSLMIKAGFSEKRCVHIPTFIKPLGEAAPNATSRTILFVGRFSPEKGVDILLRALAHLQSNDFNVEFIGGSGSEYERTLRTLVPPRLAERVVFHNFMAPDDVSNHIARSLFVVIPSIWYENLPNVVLEAFAMGRPVVASRLGSLIETIRDGETGLLFEAGDPEDLAMKMDELLARPEWAANLGMTAFRYAVQEHSVERHIRSLGEIFKRVTAERMHGAAGH